MAPCLCAKSDKKWLRLGRLLETICAKLCQGAIQKITVLLINLQVKTRAEQNAMFMNNATHSNVYHHATGVTSLEANPKNLQIIHKPSTIFFLIMGKYAKIELQCI